MGKKSRLRAGVEQFVCSGRCLPGQNGRTDKRHNLNLNKFDLACDFQWPRITVRRKCAFLMLYESSLVELPCSSSGVLPRSSTPAARLLPWATSPFFPCMILCKVYDPSFKDEWDVQNELLKLGEKILEGEGSCTMWESFNKVWMRKMRWDAMLGGVGLCFVLHLPKSCILCSSVLFCAFSITIISIQHLWSETFWSQDVFYL